MTVAYSCRSMPTISRFMASDAFIRGLVGPLGGGKSSGCVWDLAQRGVAQRPGPDGVRRSRWVVIRNTNRQLEDSTIRTFLQWFPPHIHGSWLPSKGNYTIRSLKAAADEPSAEIEFQFRALDRPDQVGNLLSTEYTGGWINEGREVPWAVYDALMGRIGRYPAMRDGGASWFGLIADTNPPDTESDWYRFFEETDHSEAVEVMSKALIARGLPGIAPDQYAQCFKQPSGLGPDAENMPNLPPAYYERQAIGKADDWIKVYLKGEYGFTVDGKPVFPEYSDNVHCPPDERSWPKLTADLPIYRSYDFGLCYSDDTEVLTGAGWKLFRDVDTETDMIATRNPANGAMEYAKAAFKVAQPFKGDMLAWASTEIDMLVTPEHRVPYTHRDHPGEVRWASAQWLSENLGRHHMVDLTAEWQGEEGNGLFGCNALAWAEFLGIYLAEGSAGRKRVVVYQNNRDPEIQRILDATGWDWRYFQPENSTGGWRLYHPMLSLHLAALGTSGTKRIPLEVREMTKDGLRAFVMAYTLGDGHIRTRANGAVEHTLFTISGAMAADMQEVAQKIGWNSSVRVVKAQVSIIQEGATLRAIHGAGGFCVTFKKRAVRAELHRRNFRRVPYDGIVYCLNVPHHTLYVRRNGKPHWNGNTPACIFSQITPDGRWIVTDELVASAMGFDEFSDTVLEYSGRHLRGCKFIDVGDPAGQQRAQTDAKTCFQIGAAKGMNIQPAPQTLQIRLEGTRKPMRTLSNGKPQFLIHPRCKKLRKALLGGYAFRRLHVSGERYTSEPNKNEHSHVADALSYAGAFLFGPALRTVRGPSEDEMARDSLLVQDRTRSSVTGY